MKIFNYRNPHKVSGWGNQFDSVLEVKYVFSISNNYEWLHTPVSIFFDPSTRQIVSYPYGNIRRYTPDFLVRNKETSEAWWIEIKPRAFNDEAQLALRKEIAENYISKNNYDWKYKIVFDDEIKLSLEQVNQFNEYMSSLKRKEKINNGRKILLAEHPSPFFKKPNNKMVEFILSGNKSSLKVPVQTKIHFQSPIPQKSSDATNL